MQMNNSNKARKITLKRGKDASLRRFHPWIFSGAIQSYDKDIVDAFVGTEHVDNVFCLHYVGIYIHPYKGWHRIHLLK